MSEISQNYFERQQKLFELCKNIIFQIDPIGQYYKNKDFISTLNYIDIVEVVHKLFEESEDLEILKKGISKFLNLFYKTFTSLPLPEFSQFSIFHYLNLNTSRVTQLLNETKAILKQINLNHDNYEVITEFRKKIETISKIVDIYTIKENILFPEIEKTIEKYKCIMVMWSIHDEVRKNLKTLLQITQNENINLKLFNQIIGQIYFNIFTIEFRDKHLLFPYLNNNFSQQKQEELLNYCKEMPFPFINPDYSSITIKNKIENSKETLDLGTGILTLEQIKLIFNHLPVDITFVDHNDKVRYFSSPKNRVFPRSTTIIGRDVRNCHPPESVAVVEKIINQFKNNQRNEAIFWIKLKDKYLHISYFAVRDENNNYKGIVEVTQEVQNIVNLTGEKRLLDYNF